MQIQVDLVQFGILFFQFLSLIVASPADQHSTQQVLAPDALLIDFEASPISTLDIDIDKNCAAKTEIITTEFKRALTFAGIVSTRFTKDNPYVKTLWPQKFWGSPIIAPDYLVYGGEYFKHVVQMGSNNDNDKRPYPNPVPKLKVTCVQTPTCKADAVIAHTDSIKGEINFCDLWDQLPDSHNVVCEDGKPLSQYESKARAIVHELTHLRFTPAFKSYVGPANDVKDASGKFAYGIPACISLAAGTWGKPPILYPEALNNADNWAWIAAGTGWLELCKKTTGNLGFRLPV